MGATYIGPNHSNNPNEHVFCIVVICIWSRTFHFDFDAVFIEPNEIVGWSAKGIARNPAELIPERDEPFKELNFVRFESVRFQGNPQCNLPLAPVRRVGHVARVWNLSSQNIA